MRTKNIFLILGVLSFAILILAGCQQSITPTTECQQDTDCAPEQCCHATSCIPAEQKGVCNLACTNFCVPGTIDCGGSCTCDSGQCTAHYKIKVSQTSCAQDSDCACGTHLVTGDCFVGNKNYVNTSKQCPDFCTGIAAMFETKCVNNTCQNARIQKTECTTNSDCAPEQCCHATRCIPAEQKGVCTLLCTNVCLPGTIDCGGSCSCQNGECIANLNNLTTEITPPAAECTSDTDCAPEQCCHATSCIPADQKGVCNLACTNVCMPGTIDCGGSCSCQNGKCIAQLNDYTVEEPVPTNVCTTDDDCVPAECCHAAECVTKDNQPNCSAVQCSAECARMTMDCGGFCACIGGSCIAQLNDL